MTRRAPPSTAPRCAVATGCEGYFRPAFTRIIGVALLVATPWCAAAESALSILEKSIYADSRVPYSATVEIRVYRDGNNPRSHVQKVIHASGNRQRVEVVAPSTESGRLIVSNGTTEWEYHPRQNVARQRELLPVAQVERHKLGALRLVQRTLYAARVGEETIAGRRCHVITVSPPDGRQTRKKVWVDFHTHVELKWARYDPGGQIMMSGAMTNVDFTRRIDSALFKFSPPAGCNVRKIARAQRMSLAAAEKRIGFRAVLPRYLPRGYALHSEQVGITQHSGRNALWLQFVNGVDTFSIFQCLRLPKPLDSGRRATYWEAHGFSFLLVGPLPATERDRIRGSMP